MDERIKLETLDLSWHILKPLAAKQIYYVDQLTGMTIEQIAVLVSGKRVLPRLMEALGRSEEYVKWSGHYDVPVMAGGVVVKSYPVGELRQLIPLIGTRRHFGFDSRDQLESALEKGERIDPYSGKPIPFSLQDIAAYKYQRDSEKTVITQAKMEMSLGQSGNAQQNIDYDKLVQDTVDRYSGDYDVTQWNQTDFDNMRSLASMKLRIQSVQRALGSLNAEQTVLMAKAAESMSSEVKGLSAEMRQLEDALGVSLKARLSREKQQEGHEIFTDFVADAKHLIAERASIAIHCGVRLGIGIIHFPRNVDTQIVHMRCPVCGEHVEWDLLPQRIMDTYVEAGDFQPLGAPVGMLNK